MTCISTTFVIYTYHYCVYNRLNSTHVMTSTNTIDMVAAEHKPTVSHRVSKRFVNTDLSGQPISQSKRWVYSTSSVTNGKLAARGLCCCFCIFQLVLYRPKNLRIPKIQVWRLQHELMGNFCDYIGCFFFFFFLGLGCCFCHP